MTDLSLSPKYAFNRSHRTGHHLLFNVVPFAPLPLRRLHHFYETILLPCAASIHSLLLKLPPEDSLGSGISKIPLLRHTIEQDHFYTSNFKSSKIIQKCSKLSISPSILLSISRFFRLSITHLLYFIENDSIPILLS